MPASDRDARRRARLAVWLVIGAIAVIPCAAAAQTDLESRLRDALRTATQRIRQLEDQQAGVTARQAELEAENQALKAQIEKLGTGGPSAADLARLFNEREQQFQVKVEEFNQRLQECNDQAVKIQQSAVELQRAYQDAAQVARAREQEREQVAGALEATQEQLKMCGDKNTALFTIGNEILDRYRDIDLADVLAVREPFLGLKRVELENAAQDYEDRLYDNRAGDYSSPPAIVPPAAPPSASAGPVR